MNCLSINIRGVGVCGKAGWIKKLKNGCGISFIGMQESMVSNVQSALVSNYWGRSGFDYEYVDANGNSSGLVSMWDPKVFVKDSMTKDINFLHVAGVVLAGSIRVNIINVYAPQTNIDKRQLWARINNIIHSNQGRWIVFGDFNAVRDRDERKKLIFDPVCARDFNDFIDEAGLREYNLKGMRYTYMSNRRGLCKLSRIDKVFVCDNVFNKWPIACVRALNRDSRIILLWFSRLRIQTLVQNPFGCLTHGWIGLVV
ncbi:putative AP endonuclease 1, Endonuclease/exonuclease/phosphatase superfamily [Helianthus annuus]|nr:putative AP endonuclease 1, Endonuclease/exonuclease/phosphatase superfamily [Helianthus annuus]